MSLPTPRHLRQCKYALAAIAALAVSCPAVAQEVWFISDSTRPPLGSYVPARVIDLDAAQRIEAELAAMLPGDPSEAERIARLRLREGGMALQRRLQAAYQGVTDAWSLGVATVPAVVVDQRYVVYGESHVDKALARIDRYRREHP